MNPKPVQERIPVLLGAMTLAGAARAARIADGINPIAISMDIVLGLITSFQEAVWGTGRDLAHMNVVVRANVSMTREPLTQDRPFLGGSARQIAEDLPRLDGNGVVDHVLFANLAAGDLDEELRLLEELQTARSAKAWVRSPAHPQGGKAIRQDCGRLAE